MKPDIFVEKLASLKPTVKDLLNLGFDSDQAKKITDSFIPQQRNKKINKIFENNSLFSLMQQYDCSNVKIGLIQFSNEIVENIDFYEFGAVEADVLVLNKITYEIEVREGISLDTILWSSASNADNFLASALLCADFFSLRIKKPSLTENSIFTYERVKACSDVAGGDKYLDFYKMLLGYFE